jgi:hypothetical protein
MVLRFGSSQRGGFGFRLVSKGLICFVTRASVRFHMMSTQEGQEGDSLKEIGQFLSAFHFYLRLSALKQLAGS